MLSAVLQHSTPQLISSVVSTPLVYTKSPSVTPPLPSVSTLPPTPSSVPTPLQPSPQPAFNQFPLAYNTPNPLISPPLTTYSSQKRPRAPAHEYCRCPQTSCRLRLLDHRWAVARASIFSRELQTLGVTQDELATTPPPYSLTSPPQPPPIPTTAV